MRWIFGWTTLCALIALAELRESFNTTPPPIRSFFSCSGRPMGYYADLETNCRAYHTCDDHGNHFTHYCPEDTAFRQDAMICDHAYLVDCQANAAKGLPIRFSQDSSHQAPPSSFVEPRGEGTNARGFARSFRINPEVKNDTASSKYPTFVLNSSVFLTNRETTSRKPTTRFQEPQQTEPQRIKTTRPQQQQQQQQDEGKNYQSPTGFRTSVNPSRNSIVTSPRPPPISEELLPPLESSRIPKVVNDYQDNNNNFNNFNNDKKNYNSNNNNNNYNSNNSNNNNNNNNNYNSNNNNNNNNNNINNKNFNNNNNNNNNNKSFDNNNSNNNNNNNNNYNSNNNNNNNNNNKNFNNNNYDDEYSFLIPPPVRDDNYYTQQQNSFESLKSDSTQRSSHSAFRIVTVDNISKKQETTTTMSPHTQTILEMAKARALGREFSGPSYSKPVNFLEPPHLKPAFQQPAGRPNFNSRSGDPYKDTLLALQNLSRASTAANQATTTSRPVSKAPSTEASIFGVPTKSLGPSGDTDTDPYYPRSSTTEAYYTPRHHESSRRPVFSTTTRRTSTSKFEIPAMLPDLNSLEDLLDRRKFFFIPQTKSA